MTEIDEITQQLTRSAAHTLRAARLAVDRHRQRTGRQRDEDRREREHRLRVFETQLRTTVLQRQLAAKQGNDQIAAELAAVERDQKAGELRARWAAAEAYRDTDPALADAWAARLREAGIDPENARALADEFAGEPIDYFDVSDEQQLAVDHVEMAFDLAEPHTPASANSIGRATGVDDGAEAARLIDIAHPSDQPVGPISVSHQVPAASTQALDLEHVAQL